MPHYADGTPAREGDLVRGKGYNIKDGSGNLKEIVGIVTGLTPKTDACKLTLLVPDGALGHFSFTRADPSGADRVVGHVITGQTEFGQTDHFVKVS